ncbi:SRPBCC family protein [bacterium SCSIO 12741]|nr:SRPBCC family protein [bacterium SCSIO 12741]
MKVFKLILGILFVVLILIAFWWATLADNYYVERRISIKATPAQIMASTKSFKNWKNWSPWQKADPEAKFTYEGEDGTVGSSMRWDSKADTVGIGTMTMNQIYGDDSIRYTIIFEHPWQMVSDGGFNCVATDSGSLLTWYDKADLPFEMRPVGKMIDDMIGPKFEQGLKAIKEIAEARAAKASVMKEEAPSMEYPEDFEMLPVEETTTSSFFYVSSVDSCSVEELSQTLGMLYGEVKQILDEKKVAPTGYPFAIYHNWDGKNTTVEAGIPVDKGKRKVDAMESYAGNVLKVVFTGPYEETETAHLSIAKYADDNDIEITGAPWEVYVTDPTQEEDPSKWIIEIYYPVK